MSCRRGPPCPQVGTDGRLLRDRLHHLHHLRHLRRQFPVAVLPGVYLIAGFGDVDHDGTFVQTVSDYPLVEAIAQDVVKHPVLPDAASRAKLIFTRQLLKDLRLVGGYDQLYPKVRTFIRDHLFMSAVDLDDPVILRNLSEPEVGTWAGGAPDKVRQAVCAFANDLPNHGRPGVVFIGANDDGSTANIEITDQLLLTLADIKTVGKTVPPPPLTVEQRTLEGAPMAVVTVWPADAPPVRFDGGIWIRIGPRRGLASAQDERVLNEKRRYRDQHFEAYPISASMLGDLSRTIFEQEYLPNAVAADTRL